MNDFGHYFRDVSALEKIDIYRFLDLFGVTGSPHQHAIKKIACAGQRGAKDARKDLNEAMVSIKRALEMLDEDDRAAMIRAAIESGSVVLEFDEDRVDRVASSHGDGEHYDDMSNPANWLFGDALRYTGSSLDRIQGIVSFIGGSLGLTTILTGSEYFDVATCDLEWISRPAECDSCGHMLDAALIHVCQ